MGLGWWEGTEKSTEASTNIPGAPASGWLNPSWVKGLEGGPPAQTSPLKI